MRGKRHLADSAMQLFVTAIEPETLDPALWPDARIVALDRGAVGEIS